MTHVSGLMILDHPRSRGVYAGMLFVRNGRLGSSPLARGLLGALARCGGEGGIIPARAGFTCGPTERVLTRKDHPRSRGVYAYAPIRP